MDFIEYQQATRRTRNDEQGREMTLANAALGIVDEGAEVGGKVKKHLFQGHPLDVAGIMEEVGDTLWYLAWAADLCGFTLEEAAWGNIDKLRRRYPDGFDPLRSIERQEEGEKA